MPDRRRFLVTAAAILAAGPVAAASQIAHDFAFAGIDGERIALADWAGRPILVVNTASRCGYTYQYDGLQALHERYRDRGLVVLGVPSDDFGQELATERAVKEFCEVNFALDFPMTAITPVKGADAHPFYAWAARSGGRPATPRWNFHKILIDPEGRVVAGFPSRVKPLDPKLTGAVEPLLGIGG